MNTVEGNIIALEAQRGFVQSQAFLKNSVETLAFLLNGGEEGQFEVTSNSLKVNGELSVEVAARAIATIAEITERNASVGSMSMLTLGDLIKHIRLQFGDTNAEELINQAICVRGKSKHTIQEAERIVKWCDEVFPDGVRPEGLSPSHLMEFKNGSRDRAGNVIIPNDKVRELVSVVQEGEIIATIETSEGEITNRKPLSCAKTRQLLKEAKPLDSQSIERQPKQVIGTVAQDENKEAAPIKQQDSRKSPIPETKGYLPPSFIYIRKDDHTDVAFSYDEFLEDDCLTGEYIILDIYHKEVLDENKKSIAHFSQI